MQTIYKKYKERFIEISGNNRSLFTRSIVKKYSYDVGALLENVDVDHFYEFLWDSKKSLTLVDEKIIKKFVRPARSTEAKSAETKAADAAANEKHASNVLDKHLQDLKYLKREVEEIQKETGKYDLCVGFPYVFGKIGTAGMGADIQIKAPLLLFPVTLEIERDTVKVNHIADQPVMINKSLILAYCKEHNIKNDNLIQEFDTDQDDSFKTVDAVVDYLNNQGIKIRSTKRKTLLSFDPASEIKTDVLELKTMAVLGRFPFANPIYTDYLALEKNNLSTPAIDMLLAGKTEKLKKTKREPVTYTMNDLDYAQENAIEAINNINNLVIYGPPGTGKSQTIVNIISDALCKNKRVLVVSQKQAALDVVYSRLGELNAKAMLIPDPEKAKTAFFDRLKLMHTQILRGDYDENEKRYHSIGFDINQEIGVLQDISDTLFTKTPFGLNLQEMYAQSVNIGKETRDYFLYTEMKKTNIMGRNYPELAQDIGFIRDKNVIDLFVKRQNLFDQNPMAVHLEAELDLHKIKEACNFLNKTLKNQEPPFDFSRYNASRYLTTFYLEKAETDRPTLDKLAGIVARLQHPDLVSMITMSMFPLFWPALPFLFHRYNQHKRDLNIDFNIALNALLEHEKKFLPLRSVLTKEGYALALGGILNGNFEFLKKLLSALEDYVSIRDINRALYELSDGVKEILDFAYTHSDRTRDGFEYVVNKIIPLRVYHEVIRREKSVEECLAKTVSFDDMRARILKLKSDQRSLTKLLAKDRFSIEYAKYFAESPQSKDYLYQIQKQRALWPIRRMLEFFDGFLFRLFPCWLLSPETVSTIFPLKRDMFDVVVFDEASQMFVENALPTIYRGNNIVIAGDNKQLRPSTGFVKRYLADDAFDPNVNLSTQAALEVESLLDLATAKYTPCNLVYHYRSQFAELIDFSNIAFYDNKLQIAPNITLSTGKPPIERIKVKGQWQNRRNHEEAAAVVKLVKQLLREREYKETIGIVTFNSEQKEYIEDMLDDDADSSPSFRKQLYAERNRVENGENQSLFVKNLENVQGDERDIIIFSIGYAKNESDKVVAQFGSLSTEGGENRLNVAITRAKRKIYVVTSIEPEELDKVETTKNNGPKLLKKYLMYVRAVSEGKPDEVKLLLSKFDAGMKRANPEGAYENQIKEGLEERGYKVYTNLGNTYYKLSLGVYDEEVGRFILGVECDYNAYTSSGSVLERDVYRIKFLESRGWKIVRVWSRDWWQNRKKVLDSLEGMILAERKRLLNSM